MPQVEPELLEMIELGFEESDEFGSGITAMSVVKSPAIKAKFIALSEQTPMKFAEADAEKRLLVGPALIPDLPIFRKDDEGKQYYAYFKSDTIEKLAYSFIKNGRQNNSTVEHQFAVEGVGLVESWIVDNPEKDKSTSLGMQVPKGTWMIAMKVNNDEVWEKWVKTGKITGFSIEAMLTDRPMKKVEQMEIDEKAEQRIEAAIEVLHKLHTRNARKKKR